tara:strand:- start:232 stop:396 length:165 start_codon:yes stop_codon:yes gene_type:complete
MSEDRPYIRIPADPPPEWREYIEKKEEERRREEAQHTGSAEEDQHTGSVVIIQM